MKAPGRRRAWVVCRALRSPLLVMAATSGVATGVVNEKRSRGDRGCGRFRPGPVPLTSVSAGDPLKAPLFPSSEGAGSGGEAACQRSAGRPPVLILVCLARPAAASACKARSSCSAGRLRCRWCESWVRVRPRGRGSARRGVVRRAGRRSLARAPSGRSGRCSPRARARRVGARPGSGARCRAARRGARGGSCAPQRVR